MTQKADVVIIGGGIVGVSTAYYLSRLGVRNVTLLERDLLGEGSTIRCAGIIRGLFSTEINCRFGAESLRIYRRYEEEIGSDISFRETGYLVLLAESQDLSATAETVALQNRLGLDSRFVGPEEISALAPWMRTEGLAGGIYSSEGGYASQHEVVMGFARRAREMGARLREGLPATGIRVAAGRVVGVDTPEGPIESDVVVLAAGVWSRELAAGVGVDLPVFPSRSHIVMLRPQGGIPDHMPVISDFGSAFYARPEVDQLLVGMTGNDEPVSFRTDVEWDFIYSVLPAVAKRMPFTETAGLGTVYAGSIEYTPDKHPVLGGVPEVAGLVVAAGFSGHGFMHGPVAGKLTAELVALGAARTIDISSLDIRRFDREPPAGLAPIREELSYQRKAISNYRREPMVQ